MDQAVCCYRHPDRETGVRCTRCDRPICPDCMISASVGFHCPDCVSEHRQDPQTARAARVRAPRTIAGGRQTLSPRLITIALILVNVVVFIAAAERHHADRPVRAVPARDRGRPVVPAGDRDVPARGPHRTSGSTCCRCGGSARRWRRRSAGPATSPCTCCPGSAAARCRSCSPRRTPRALGASGAIFGLFGALFVLVRRVGGDLRPIVILIVAEPGVQLLHQQRRLAAHVGGLVTGSVDRLRHGARTPRAAGARAVGDLCGHVRGGPRGDRVRVRCTLTRDPGVHLTYPQGE